jgi:general secretion pathway protein M
MVERLNPRERKIVAVGLLAALVLLFFMGIVSPYVDRVNLYRQHIEEHLFRLQRLKRAAEQAPQIADQTRDLQRRFDELGYLLQQGTPALAAAEVQRQVQKRVEEIGGNVRSVQVNPATQEGALTRVSVRVRLSATSEVLAELLGLVEEQRPLFFVEYLDIRSAVNRNRRRQPEQESDALEIDLHLAAYMRGQEA